MMNEIVLTEHQSEILYQSLDVLSRSNRLLITGKAGTGKSTLMKFLLRELKRKEREDKRRYSSDLKSVCSAPTNKAVKVLKEKIGEEFGKYNDFKTTHSALRLQRYINERNGTVEFKPDKYGEKPLQGVNILIVDEASMLNTELLKYIEEYSERIKVIFIGDEAQLPPVGEPVSPVFTAGYPKVELTEIIRQGEGNPIIDLSRDFSLIKSRKDNRKNIGGYIFSNDTDKVIETLAAINGTDDLKYLAWTNKEVDYINSQVRRRIYGNPKKVEIGESLIFNTPYDKFFTNEEITVITLEVVERNLCIYKIINPEHNAENIDQPEFLERYEKLKMYIVNREIPIIHEDSEKLFKEICKDLSSKAKAGLLRWKDFYNFMEGYADIKYNHAITVHKSQGSSYNQVIINMRDLSYNKDINEYNKLLYTAITRAKELVILYKV